jgi:hypothetical protein
MLSEAISAVTTEILCILQPHGCCSQKRALLVLQVKLLEGGTQAGGISAFLGKAVEPPAAAVVQHAVSSLQLIGALTCVAANSTACALTLHCRLHSAHQASPGGIHITSFSPVLCAGIRGKLSQKFTCSQRCCRQALRLGQGHHLSEVSVTCSRYHLSKFTNCS